MREIKFRAWDSKYHVMRGKVGVGMKGEPLRWDTHDGPLDGSREYPQYESSYCDGYILLQFTGLKDKNGKDVYEGDIIEAWFPGMPHERVVLQEIMFYEGCFGCGNIPLKTVDKFNLLVVGNIYENGDLLK